MWAGGQEGGDSQASDPPSAPAQLRHAPAGVGCRPAPDPDSAGTPERTNHAALHTGHRGPDPRHREPLGPAQPRPGVRGPVSGAARPGSRRDPAALRARLPAEAGRTFGAAGARRPGAGRLPHRGAGRARGGLRRLWAPGDLLQLLPEPALSQVPGCRDGRVAGARAEAPAGRALRARGLHAAAGAGTARPAEPAGVLRPPLPGRRTDAAGDRSGPAPPGSTDRLSRYPAHLGSDAPAPPAPALPGASRRTLPGGDSLDRLPGGILPSGARAGGALPRQVSGIPGAEPSAGQARLSRPAPPACRATGVQRAPASGPDTSVGRLRQAALRWGGAGAEVP